MLLEEKDDNLGAVPEETGETGTETVGTEGTGETGTEQGTEKGAETTPEKTPISDEERKKYGIPDKFKYFQDVVKWGTEAEKAKSRAEQEKAKYERDLEDREAVIADFEKSLKKQEASGEITEEEKLRITDQFQNDFATDPVGTMDKLFKAYERRLDEKQQREKQGLSWKEEENEIKKRYPDNWDSEIKPVLAKIASKRPYLQSIEEVVAIYEMEKKKEELLNNADSDKKKTEKKSAFTETGAGRGVVSKDIYDKIASAKTVEELEAATKSLPRAPERE